MLSQSDLSKDIIEKIQNLAIEVAAKESCSIYDIEFVGSGQSRVLRIYLDKNEGGVGIEECSRVSKGMSILLDDESFIPGAGYQLEVSTPGLERPLRRQPHFDQAAGKLAYFSLKQDLKSLGSESKKWSTCKRFEAKVLGTKTSGNSDSDVPAGETSSAEFSVRIQVADEDNRELELLIPSKSIDKAKLVFDFGLKSNEGAKGHSAPKPGSGKAKHK